MSPRRIQTRNHDRRRQQLLDLTARYACSCRVDRAIVDDEKPEPFAVRTESRRANTAIEVFSGLETRRRPAAVRGHEREMVHAVRAVLHLVAFKKRDHLSIRAPLRPRTSGARACRR